jgi:hypothetical protein
MMYLIVPLLVLNLWQTVGGDSLRRQQAAVQQGTARQPPDRAHDGNAGGEGGGGVSGAP